MAKTKSLSSFWKKAKDNGGKDSFGGDAVPLEPQKCTMQLCGASIDDFAGERKVMLTWAVVEAPDDDDKGTVCKYWEGIGSEERLIWLQRLLVGLGVDLDDVTVDDEADLLKVFEDLIEAKTCAAVAVVQKDGYTNMKIRKVVEVDDGDTLDPEEVMKAVKAGKTGGKSSSSGSGKKKDDEAEDGADGEGEDLAEGMVISFKHPATKKKSEGEIVGFDDDDDPKVKIDGEKKAVVVPVANVLEIVSGGEDDDKKEDDKEGDGDVDVDDIVIVNHKKKDKKGVVTKVKGESVFVKIKGEDEPIQFDKSEVKSDVDD